MKAVTLVPEQFTVENDLLTPTFKVNLFLVYAAVKIGAILSPVLHELFEILFVFLVLKLKLLALRTLGVIMSQFILEFVYLQSLRFRHDSSS